MTDQPYDFIETEELEAEENDENHEHITGVGSNVVNPDPSPTLLESILGFLKGLVR